MSTHRRQRVTPTIEPRMVMMERVNQGSVDLLIGMPTHFAMPTEFIELAAWSTQLGYARNGCAYLADPDRGENCLVFVNDPARTGWGGYLSDPDRLWFVAATGGEGSSICLWLDDDGCQQVVHHGSGSGSVLFAVLPSALAVLRLFAVGYEEPCWNTEWAEAPNADAAPLHAYRQWAFERWGVRPAQSGLAALGLQDDASGWTDANGPKNDPFSEWLSRPGTVVGS
jgi:hypothetical protein